MPRVKLRTCLVLVAVSALLCWEAARLWAWHVNRPIYRALVSYHSGLAESVGGSVSLESNLYKIAAHYLPQLLARHEPDSYGLTLQQLTPIFVRSHKFHPFSGPRSGWAAAVEAQREKIERLKKQAAFHARMEREFRRASESFFAPTPTEGYLHPLPEWLDPEVLERVRAMTPAQLKAANARRSRVSTP